MKLKGTTLLETIVSVMILSIIISIFYNLTIQNIEERQRRKISEEISRVVFCIMQEIKYNYTMEEVKSITSGTGLNIAYYEDLLLDLVKKPLTSLPQGDDIRLTLKEEHDGIITIQFSIKVMLQEMFFTEQKILVKSKWMEMINEG